MPNQAQIPAEAPKFRVGVYRVLVGDTDELKLERHKARGAAVMAEFTNADDVTVLSWGDAADEEPHEFVELLVAVVGSPEVQSAATSVITWMGLKLAEKAIDDASTAGFKALARRIFRAQKAEKQVNDAWITGPDGAPRITMFPPEWGSGSRTVAEIVFSDHSRVEFHAPPDGWTGDPELERSGDRLKS